MRFVAATQNASGHMGQFSCGRSAKAGAVCGRPDSPPFFFLSQRIPFLFKSFILLFSLPSLTQLMATHSPSLHDPNEAKRWLIIGAYHAGASENRIARISGLSKTAVRRIILNYQRTEVPSLPQELPRSGMNPKHEGNDAFAISFILSTMNSQRKAFSRIRRRR